MTDILSVLDSINKVAEVGMKSGQEMRQAEIDELVGALRTARRYVCLVRSDDVAGDDPIFSFLDEVDALLSRYPVPR
jgi:hypothetical protein